VPWEALDASVEAAWWLDDDRGAAAIDPEEEALDGSGDGLKPGELGMWSVQQAAFVFGGCIASVRADAERR